MPTQMEPDALPRSDANEQSGCGTQRASPSRGKRRRSSGCRAAVVSTCDDDEHEEVEGGASAPSGSKEVDADVSEPGRRQCRGEVPEGKLRSMPIGSGGSRQPGQTAQHMGVFVNPNWRVGAGGLKQGGSGAREPRARCINSDARRDVPPCPGAARRLSRQLARCARALRRRSRRAAPRRARPPCAAHLGGSAALAGGSRPDDGVRSPRRACRSRDAGA